MLDEVADGVVAFYAQLGSKSAIAPCGSALLVETGTRRCQEVVVTLLRSAVIFHYKASFVECRVGLWMCRVSGKFCSFDFCPFVMGG